MNGVPDGYVGSASSRISCPNLGVTPTNLVRAYHPIEQASRSPHFQRSCRATSRSSSATAPDGFEPQTKSVESATGLGELAGVVRDDLALGFGLGLILATACAIA